jgi:hypothetical protein
MWFNQIFRFDVAALARRPELASALDEGTRQHKTTVLQAC